MPSSGVRGVRRRIMTGGPGPGPKALKAMVCRTGGPLLLAMWRATAAALEGGRGRPRALLRFMALGDGRTLIPAADLFLMC